MMLTIQPLAFNDHPQTIKALHDLEARFSGAHFNVLEGNPNVDSLENEFIFWFVSGLNYEEVIDQAQALSSANLARTMLVDYDGESPLRLLEEIKALGLVKTSSLQAWFFETPAQFLKLGQGQGLLGLKRYFSSTHFDDSFFDVQSSKNYMIFYDYDVHDLGKILHTYLKQVASSASQAPVATAHP